MGTLFKGKAPQGERFPIRGGNAVAIFSKQHPVSLLIAVICVHKNQKHARFQGKKLVSICQFRHKFADSIIRWHWFLAFPLVFRHFPTKLLPLIGKRSLLVLPRITKMLMIRLL